MEHYLLFIDLWFCVCCEIQYELSSHLLLTACWCFFLSETWINFITLWRNYSNSSFFECHSICHSCEFSHFMTRLTEEWDEQKKQNNNPGSFEAQYLWACKVTRHAVAWYRPETKAWMKPELASLLSVAMTTAAVSWLKKKKKVLRGPVARGSTHWGNSQI